MKKILFLLFTCACFSKSFAQDWINFNSTEGKFSVLLPAQPKAQTDTSKSYPNYITSLFITRTNTDIFVLGWVDYEEGFTFDEQKELEANRDNFIKAINGTLIETKNVAFKGYRGLEFSAQAGAYFWTSKVFMVGRRPYQLVVGSGSGKASENENKFYDSFTITK